MTSLLSPAGENHPREAFWAGTDNPNLIAALCSLGAALWRRNLLLTIVFGMTLFMVLKWGLEL